MRFESLEVDGITKHRTTTSSSPRPDGPEHGPGPVTFL
jgi:hypothetical protein